VYAAELAIHQDDWDVKTVIERANKACAICSASVGYKDALPWADQLLDYAVEPIYDTIDDLTKRPKKKSLPWQAKASAPRSP